MDMSAAPRAAPEDFRAEARRARSEARAALERLHPARAARASPAAAPPGPDPASPRPIDAPPGIPQNAGSLAPQADLTCLPGIGPGLAWAFGRAGIGSPAALAAADPAQLERDLGLIGALLDLPALVEAAGRIAAQSPHPPGTRA